MYESEVTEMKKRVPALMLASAIALSAAGCSGGNQPSSGSAAPSTSGTPSSTATAPDKDLVVAFNTDIQKSEAKRS
mgnify:FL=1